MAILMVMLYHQTVVVGTTAVDRFFGFWTLGGWMGVDLFFVLSGFLITGILYEARNGERYFRNFYARRVLRIFPLYYAVVAFSLLILTHIPNWKSDSLGRINGDELWYWVYLSNVPMAIHNAFRHGILDVSWSLAIEEQFYLVWPLLVLLLTRKQLMWLCGCVCAGALLFRTVALLAGMQTIAVYVLTPGRLDDLAIGAFIALAARGSLGVPHLLRRAAPLGAIACVTLVLAIAVVSGGFDQYGFVMETVGYSAIGLLFGCILVLVLTSSRTGLLQSGALVTFGKYSYALYLFHLPIRAVLRDQVYGPDRFLTVFGSSLPGQLLFYAVATSIAFAAAWLSWHLYEQQFLKLKRYFEPVTQGGAREYEPRFSHTGGLATLVVGAAVWTRRTTRGILSELARSAQIPIRGQSAAQSSRDQRLLAVPAEHYQRATYQPGGPDGGLVPRDPAQQNLQ